MREKEIWKDIEGYEGYYMISNMGRVKSLGKYVEGRRGYLKEKLLSPYANHRGYLLVILHKYNVKYRRTVHRLVANAFIRNTKNKEEVNHIDGIKDNNKARNLEWATRVENCHHAIYTLGKDQKGQNHPQAKYTQKQILKVFALWQTGKYSKAEIGRRFGMPRSYAGSVINRRTWKHLII